MANVEHSNDAVRPVHEGAAGNAGEHVSRMQAEVQQAQQSGNAAGSSRLNDGSAGSGPDSPGAGLPKLDIYDGSKPSGGGGGHKGDMGGGGSAGKNRCFSESGGNSRDSGMGESGTAGGSTASHRGHEGSRALAAGGTSQGAEAPTKHYRHR